MPPVEMLIAPKIVPWPSDRDIVVHQTFLVNDEMVIGEEWKEGWGASRLYFGHVSHGDTCITLTTEQQTKQLITWFSLPNGQADPFMSGGTGSDFGMYLMRMTAYRAEGAVEDGMMQLQTDLGSFEALPWQLSTSSIRALQWMLYFWQPWKPSGYRYRPKSDRHLPLADIVEQLQALQPGKPTTTTELGTQLFGPRR